jgi:hypothetical protein
MTVKQKKIALWSLVVIAVNTTIMQAYQTIEYYHIDALLPG